MIGPVALFVSILFGSYAAQDVQKPPQERRVQKPAAGVDFTCHSQVDMTSDKKKFILNHFITNNSTSPLSVEWKDAGIICVGTDQLPPRYTDRGRSGVVTEEPALVMSRIRYGVKLNYDTLAQIYVDPQATAKAEVLKRSNKQETTYERRNEQNEVVFSIQVISTFDQDSETAELTFRIEGGFSLALATDAPPRGDGGGILRGFTNSGSNEFQLGDKSVDTRMKKWFKGDRADGNYHFLVLKNPTNEPVEFTTIFGRGASGEAASESEGRLTLKRMHLVAFRPGQLGFVGVTALAYLPEDLPVR
jgi:hypothetical protein